MKKYIDADSLSKIIADTRYKLPHDIKDFFTRDYMLLNFQEIIDFEPAADVEEVRHGYNKTNMNPVDEFWCSECGFCCADFTETTLDEDGDHMYSECEFNYCPHCGAKMDKED